MTLRSHRSLSGWPSCAAVVAVGLAFGCGSVRNDPTASSDGDASGSTGSGASGAAGGAGASSGGGGVAGIGGSAGPASCWKVTGPPIGTNGDGTEWEKRPKLVPIGDGVATVAYESGPMAARPGSPGAIMNAALGAWDE